VVNQPGIDCSLFAFQMSMEARGEVVSGVMLMAKCALLEVALEIPQAERLAWGWLQSFKTA